MVTYSLYGPTGETSYSKTTEPPSEYPKSDTKLAEGGSKFPSRPARTNEGRNINLPSNLHGYSRSSPLRSPTVFPVIEGASQGKRLGSLKA
mmetsp:Transcript_16926/g.34458  ORF Transcript_16926/g.34458 Transcript_16926/m.34458 type:complete len:91 (+) Transcript_16926:1072-1344(+)